MKNIKVLGLAIAASLVAAPVFAGETYVRNEWTDTKGVTATHLTLDSDTISVRAEKYDSNADKVYVDGKVSKEGGYWGKPQTVSYNDYSVHTASSSLWGKYLEISKTSLDGHIKSLEFTKSNSHETSA